MGGARVLAGCGRPLAEEYDGALLDLDGVVYLGPRPVAGAAEAIRGARGAGMRVAFVTNNATRTPERVAEHLRALGVEAAEADVVTSPQAAARVLRGLIAPGARVLVVGGEGLVEAVSRAGYLPVRRVADEPVAVAQGLAPGVTYDDLAEAALALGRGVPWVATNVDATLPTDRGLLPGNGAYVALLREATGREPVVAGKPYPALHEEAVSRLAADRPLVVGDRLDTDIAGAVAAGCDSLHVLTGVHGLADLAVAPPSMRPTYVGAGLDALLRPAPEVRPGSPGPGGRPETGGWSACGRWAARVVDGRVDLAVAEPAPADAADAGDVTGAAGLPDDGLDAARAALAAAWAWRDAGGGDVALPDNLAEAADAAPPGD